jgi:hypothetical protein
MKITPLIFGLLLAAGAPLLVGAPTQDVQLSTPPRKDSPSISDCSSPALVGLRTPPLGMDNPPSITQP